MTLTDGELLDVIDEVTIALGEILLRHRQLTESLVGDDTIKTSQDRIEKRRTEIEKLRNKIRKARETARRRRELEKVRKDHEKKAVAETTHSARLIAVRDGGGRVVGWLQSVGGGKVNVLDRRGVVVAREIGTATLDRRGLCVGGGVRQGLRILGQSLRQ